MNKPEIYLISGWVLANRACALGAAELTSDIGSIGLWSIYLGLSELVASGRYWLRRSY